MIAREVKRKKLVKKYAAKRKSLLDEFNAAKDPMERLEIHRKIQGLPRNSAPTRVRNRCWATAQRTGCGGNGDVRIACHNAIRDVLYTLLPSLPDPVPGPVLQHVRVQRH